MKKDYKEGMGTQSSRAQVICDNNGLAHFLVHSANDSEVILRSPEPVKFKELDAIAKAFGTDLIDFHDERDSFNTVRPCNTVRVTLKKE